MDRKKERQRLLSILGGMPVTIKDWELRYQAVLSSSETGGKTGRVTPSELVIEFSNCTSPSRMVARSALDIACGTGANSLWLAQAGWQVTAVDGASSAIAILNRDARSKGISLRSAIADLEAGEFLIAPDSFDLILMHRYWQKGLLVQIQQGVRCGGLAIVVALLRTEDKSDAPYRLAPGELKSYFNGWELLHDFEGVRAGHSVAEVVARRPK